MCWILNIPLANPTSPFQTLHNQHSKTDFFIPSPNLHIILELTISISRLKQNPNTPSLSHTSLCYTKQFKHSEQYVQDVPGVSSVLIHTTTTALSQTHRLSYAPFLPPPPNRELPFSMQSWAYLFLYLSYGFLFLNSSSTVSFQFIFPCSATRRSVYVYILFQPHKTIHRPENTLSYAVFLCVLVPLFTPFLHPRNSSSFKDSSTFPVEPSINPPNRMTCSILAFHRLPSRFILYFGEWSIYMSTRTESWQLCSYLSYSYLLEGWLNICETIFFSCPNWVTYSPWS